MNFELRHSLLFIVFSASHIIFDKLYRNLSRQVVHIHYRPLTWPTSEFLTNRYHGLQAEDRLSQSNTAFCNVSQWFSNIRVELVLSLKYSLTQFHSLLAATLIPIIIAPPQ